MFPDDITEFIENEGVTITSGETTVFNGTSFLYDFEKGDFVYKNGAPVVVTGVEAIRVWIEKVIRTDKFKFDIYKDGEENYGVYIEDLLGSNFPKGFVESEMRRELTESILKNPYIEELIEWSFERDGSSLTINFTVVLFDGATTQIGVSM